jgi:uncharacterized protein YjbJ (UPF0337 family)
LVVARQGSDRSVDGERENPLLVVCRCTGKRRKELAMGDRKQRLKGKANEAVGKAKERAGYETGRGGTELEGDKQRLKGETQQAVGKARSAVKKATR